MRDDDKISFADSPIGDVKKLIPRIYKIFKPEAQKDPWFNILVDGIYENIDTHLQSQEFVAIGRTKSQKTAARRIVNALRRVEIELNSIERSRFYFRSFPRAELRDWRLFFEELSSGKSGKLTRLNAAKKRFAITKAYELLYDYYPSYRITAAKDGKFCKLSALLYGYPDIDLSNQCKAHLIASKKSGSK